MEATKSPRHEPIWRVVPLNARQADSSIPPSFNPGILKNPLSSRRYIVHQYENNHTNPNNHRRSLSRGSKHNDPLVEETVHRILEYPTKGTTAVNTVQLPRFPQGGDTELYQAVMNMQQRSKEARYAAAVKTKDSILKAANSPPPVLPYKDQLNKVEQAVAELKQSIAVHPPSINPNATLLTTPVPTNTATTTIRNKATTERSKSKTTVYGNDPWNVPVTNPKAGVRIYQPPKTTVSKGRSTNVQVVLPGANVGIQADVAGYVLPELPRKHVQAVGETATQTDIVDTVIRYKQNGYNSLHPNKKYPSKSKENKPPFDLHTGAHNCQHTKHSDTDHPEDRTLVGIRRTGGGFTNIVRARSSTVAVPSKSSTKFVKPTVIKGIEHVEDPNEVYEINRTTNVPVPVPSTSSISMDQLLTFVTVFGSELAKNMGQATANMIQQTLLLSLPSPVVATDRFVPAPPVCPPTLSQSASNEGSDTNGLNDSLGRHAVRRPSVGRDVHLLTPRQQKLDMLRTETDKLVNTASNLQNNMNTILTELLDRELRVNALTTELTNNLSTNPNPLLPRTEEQSSSTENITHKYKATLRSTVTVTPRRKAQTEDLVYDTTIMNANINVIPLSTLVPSSVATSSVSNGLKDNIPPPSTFQYDTKPDSSIPKISERTVPVVPSYTNDIQSQNSVFKPLGKTIVPTEAERVNPPQIQRQRINITTEGKNSSASSATDSRINQISIPRSYPTKNDTNDDLSSIVVTEDENYTRDPYVDMVQMMEKDISVGGDKNTLLPSSSSSTAILYESFSKYPHPSSIASSSRSSNNTTTSSKTNSSMNFLEKKVPSRGNKKTTAEISNHSLLPSSSSIDNQYKSTLQSSSLSHRPPSTMSSVMMETASLTYPPTVLLPPHPNQPTDEEEKEEIVVVPSYARNSVLGNLLVQQNRTASSSRTSSVRLRTDSIPDNIFVRSTSQQPYVSSSTILLSRPSSSLAASSSGSNQGRERRSSTNSSTRISPLVMHLAEVAFQDAQKAISKVTLE